MPSHANFVHLRVHSAFSLLEGAMQPDELAALCKKLRMPAIAVTDTNNLFGLYDLTEALSKAGVQPIVGCQLTLQVESTDAPKGRTASTQARNLTGAIAVLVQDETGYANLMKLASKAHLDVQPGDLPHVTWEALERHHEGLIVLTGGPKGLLNKLLVAGQHDAAEAWIVRLRQLFGDRLYIELQRHGLPDEIAAEKPLLQLAYAHAVPLVATNEPYFGAKEMYAAHDALLCVADGNYVMQDDRRRESPDHYFKSAEQMTALFADLPEAIDNTLEIALRCAFMPKKRSPILPQFVPASGLSPEAELRAQAERGLKERLAVNGMYVPEKDYWERLNFELDVIINMKFPGYFLIVSDFMKWTRSQGIPVGVRGS
ncbi:MAG: PHP domain-containing protein, partial [Alphaproteobacteria bacterium]|nr:PHP domain-containing protein [Alphaproteobacteria bacterium]